MEDYKQQAQKVFNEYYKDTVEFTEKFVGEVEDHASNSRKSLNEAVGNPYDTIDKARDGIDNLVNRQRVEQAQDKIETEASIVVGYKDQFLGSVKEAFGRVLKDQDLARAGHQQKLKGEAEVALQKALGEEKRNQKLHERIVETLMRREALLAQLAQEGGFAQMEGKLRHIEVREPEVSDLFIGTCGKKSSFALKRYDVQQLLDDIRNRRTRKPMLYVEVRERGLMRSIPLKKNDIKFKGRTLYTDLWASIRRSDPQRLHHVPRAMISDRSQPRVDLLRSLASADARRSEVLKDVVNQRPYLIHTETEDKTKALLAEQKRKEKGKEKDNGAGVFEPLPEVRAGTNF